MVSAKAEKLLAVIQAKGGGILDEYLLRDKTGLSHGSIVAGRKELEMAGIHNPRIITHMEDFISVLYISFNNPVPSIFSPI